ncbi:MAG: hypothetical protein LH471_02885 [Salinibacterium sp.]|nr:hypothetical protein [Salinibacterium sp.]
MSITTEEPNKTRNLIFIIVGALVIVATYLYLIIGQPTDIAAGLGPSSLIALAGYLIGAILIVSAPSIACRPTHLCSSRWRSRSTLLLVS